MYSRYLEVGLVHFVFRLRYHSLTNSADEKIDDSFIISPPPPPPQPPQPPPLPRKTGSDIACVSLGDNLLTMPKPSLREQ